MSSKIVVPPCFFLKLADSGLAEDSMPLVVLAPDFERNP
jgi:hypothetical protein